MLSWNNIFIHWIKVQSENTFREAFNRSFCILNIIKKRLEDVHFLLHHCMHFLTGVLLPGNSGFGSYHGRWGFENFSHQRAVMLRGWALERLNSLRYPPYEEGKLSWLRWTASHSCTIMWLQAGLETGAFYIVCIRVNVWGIN